MGATAADHSTARANIPPTHPQLDRQTSCEPQPAHWRTGPDGAGQILPAGPAMAETMWTTATTTVAATAMMMSMAMMMAMRMMVRMTTLTMMAPSLVMATVVIRGVGRSSTCARARGPHGIIQVAYAIPPTPRRSQSVRRSWKLSTGLRPIPPPCLGGGSEASWMLVGISWLASRGPLGGSLGASWGPFWGLLGPLLGLLGASWGVLGASWGFLGASWGGELDFSVRVLSLQLLLGPSWGSPGPS